jgi:hypothetical protein
MGNHPEGLHILCIEVELRFITLLTLSLKGRRQHVQFNALMEFIAHVCLALVYIAHSFWLGY